MKIVAKGYEAWQNARPTCCATCCFYDDDGYCSEFEDVVPPEFAEQINACDSWQDEVPF